MECFLGLGTWQRPSHITWINPHSNPGGLGLCFFPKGVSHMPGLRLLLGHSQTG